MIARGGNGRGATIRGSGQAVSKTTGTRASKTLLSKSSTVWRVSSLHRVAADGLAPSTNDSRGRTVRASAKRQKQVATIDAHLPNLKLGRNTVTVVLTLDPHGIFNRSSGL